MASTRRKSGTRTAVDRSTTTEHPLAEKYFRWLVAQTRTQKKSEDDPAFSDLLRLMFNTEFAWTVHHDDNRVEDGRDLRTEFCYQKGMATDTLKDAWAVSFLEVLIGLSRRLAFTAGGRASGWAWQLIENLELNRFPDPLTPKKAKRVEDILDTCIWRTYGPDGQGGFFPLAWPDEDQTKVELWYQMAAYINELHPEHH